MKVWKIILGLVLIATATLLILEAIGVIEPIASKVGEITFWQAFGGIILCCGIIALLSSGQFWEIFVLLGFLFMIFEKNIAYICGTENDNIMNNWLVFGCSLLLSAGFMFLIPITNRKKKHSGVKVNVKCNEMGAATVYIDCNEFGNSEMVRSVQNKLGALEVYFENTENYGGGATLYIENKLGATEIYVPKNWKLKCDDLNVKLGALEVNQNDSPGDSPLLILEGQIKLGAVEVYRV